MNITHDKELLNVFLPRLFLRRALPLIPGIPEQGNVMGFKGQQIWLKEARVDRKKKHAPLSFTRKVQHSGSRDINVAYSG